MNSKHLPQLESDDPTEDSSFITFVASLPQVEDQGFGGDMCVHWNESCDGNDDSTMLNAVTTEQGNLALSWTLAIQCILIS